MDQDDKVSIKFPTFSPLWFLLYVYLYDIETEPVPGTKLSRDEKKNK